MPSSHDLLTLAADHHQNGRLDQAEALYLRVLTSDAQHADALHLLGVLRHQRGDSDAALPLISAAIQRRPDAGGYHANLGLVFESLGTLREASLCYEEALRLEPGSVVPTARLAALRAAAGDEGGALAVYLHALESRPGDAPLHLQFGMLVERLGRTADAVALYRQALVLQPVYAEAHVRLGNLLTDSGRPLEALPHLAEAVALDPQSAPAVAFLGNALRAAGRAREAIQCLCEATGRLPGSAAFWNMRAAAHADAGEFAEAAEAAAQALAIDPIYDQAHTNRGHALRELGRFPESLACLDAAVAANPCLAAAHSNRGVTLERLGRYAEATNAFEKAVDLAPGYTAAWVNLGSNRRSFGQYALARDAYERAVATAPESAEAHVQLGQLLLLLGDFRHGWPEYEWRWRLPAFAQREWDRPLWDGRRLECGTLLLHAEQGFGDTLQFLRLASLAAQRAGRVVVECQPELLRLARTVEGVSDAVPAGSPLPGFEAHAPLLGLPALLGLTPETVPAPVPYLTPPAPLPAPAWPPRRIGLVWAGNPAHVNDARRSIPFSVFEPLLAHPSLTFFSLQQGGAAPVEDLVSGCGDLAGTATALGDVDLVISADTAVAHLAGALNRPVWLLLPFDPDWRWMLGRADSPWYPSMRLFRQPEPGDWRSVVRCVSEALA